MKKKKKKIKPSIYIREKETKNILNEQDKQGLFEDSLCAQHGIILIVGHLGFFIELGVVSSYQNQPKKTL